MKGLVVRLEVPESHGLLIKYHRALSRTYLVTAPHRLVV